MAKYSYNEIYYASSEKSAMGGFSGFGVRAYTEGMSTDVVDAVINSGINKYTVNADRMLTYEQIQHNPRIVYDYAPIYISTIVNVDGRDYYVIGRLVYIGIDYGYFCGGDACRAGSNYFAHYLVFDEQPPLDIFRYISSASLFLPHDYTCSPTNEELRMLLSGEPPRIGRKTIEIVDEAEWKATFNADAARCLVAYLQAYTNRQKQTEESLQKIIIKTPADKEALLVQNLALLPEKLGFVAYFTTNYTRGGGVPARYQMVFVNEFNENDLYEGNYICVDLFTQTTKNIDNNIFYDKIVELAELGDFDLLKKVLHYYLNLDLTISQDFPFLYNLFTALQSDKEFELSDLDAGFVQKVTQLNLTSAEDNVLWGKINRCLNEGFKIPIIGKLQESLHVLNRLLSSPKANKIEINPDTYQHVTTKVLFGKNAYLVEVAKPELMDAILYITDKSLIPSEESFYNALQPISHEVVWEKLLNHYYGNLIVDKIDIVLQHILESTLSSDDQEKLIQTLYPSSRYKEVLFAYVLNHLNHLLDLQFVMQPLLLESTNERFSEIIKKSQNNEIVINVLSPWVLAYYENLLHKDAEFGIQKLIAFVETISPEVFNLLEVNDLFVAYINQKQETSKSINLQRLEQIKQLGIELDKESQDKLNTLISLMTDQDLETTDFSMLKTAHKLQKSSEYLLKLFELCLKNSPTVEQFKAYLLDVKDIIDSAYIEGMVLAIWKTRLDDIKQNREQYILTIMDNTQWDKASKKAFMENCKYADLVEFLHNNSGIVNKLIKKISNLFHEK